MEIIKRLLELGCDYVASLPNGNIIFIHKNNKREIPNGYDVLYNKSTCDFIVKAPEKIEYGEVTKPYYYKRNEWDHWGV